MNRRDFLKLGSAALGGLALSGLQMGKSAATRPNVLILLFDTLSAPHLSLHGYPRRTSPNLERFAQRATVYHAHLSSGSYTIPGTASILTGLYPWNHRAINPSGFVRRDLQANNLFRAVGPGYYRIGYGQNLWAELFLRQFHADLDLHLPTDSFAFSNPLLLSRINRADPLPYLAFDDFLVGGVKLDAPYPGSITLGVLDLAAGRGRKTDPELAALDPSQVPFNEYFYYQNHVVFEGIQQTVREAAARGQPYFGYFHLWSPHGPYARTREFVGIFADDLKTPRKPLHPLIGEGGLRHAVLARYSQAYDEYIANVDYEFGLLLDGLEESGALENTHVVVLSDHGQLFERGVHGHSSPLLYDQAIHVPLIISAPGQTERQDIYLPTNNVDILPTLAALTGGEAPAQLDGQVLPGLGGPLDEARPLFCVDAKESSAFGPLNRGTFVLVRGRYKLIWYAGYPRFEDMLELYDLQADPHELHDLASAEAVLARQMKEELGAAREAADRPYTPAGRG